MQIAMFLVFSENQVTVTAILGNSRKSQFLLTLVGIFLLFWASLFSCIVITNSGGK